MPPGNWYELFPGKKHSGDKEVYVDCPLHILPVFVKESAIIPSQVTIQNTAQQTSSQLILHVYNGEESSEFDYYEDDGSTYDYKKGDHYLRKFRFDGNSKSIILEEAHGSFPSRFEEVQLVLHGFSEDQVFKLNGSPLETKKGVWRYTDQMIEVKAGKRFPVI